MRRLIAVLAATLPLILSAQTLWRNEGVPEFHSENIKWDQSTSISTGEAVVDVWVDSRNGYPQIFAQRINGEGEPVGCRRRGCELESVQQLCNLFILYSPSLSLLVRMLSSSGWKTSLLPNGLSPRRLHLMAHLPGINRLKLHSMNQVFRLLQ